MNALAAEPCLNTRNDEAFQFLGLPTLLRASGETTNGAFGLIEHWEMPVGWETPYHTHHRDDEAFYVLEGEMAFVCAGKWVKGAAGAYVFGPREMAHGFKVIGGRPARMLILCSPAGFENFVLELRQPASAAPAPPDIPRLIETAARYGIEILGPLPPTPSEWEQA
jgi:quercetin dioxygenase-like cupin family protein